MKGSKYSYLGDSEHYQQLSEIIKKSYQNTSDISLYIQIDQINQWIKSTNTKPLLITSQEFGGKKTLICELINHIQKSRASCRVISEFASVTPYYSEIIYKITMQLRALLGINQKVELNEEKLRQYFRYWLEVADEKIQKDYLCYSKDQKMQFVIIIEGVDKVVDSKNQAVGPSFWLPDLNLKNIKIILTSESSSSTVEMLQPTLSQKIQFVIPQVKIKAIKQKLCKQNPKLLNFKEDIHFGDLKIAKKILDTHPKMQIKEKDLIFETFFMKFVQYASSFIDSQENIYKLLGCLIWSKKGLTKNTLRRSYKFQTAVVNNFIEIFKEIIIINSQTYLILNRRMKQYINKIIHQKMTHIPNIKKNSHILMSKALKRQNNSINILQQQVYHLSQSHNYTELKELLSRVQNFLVLYTPLTKHLLCVCWFQLEIQFQYDPVFQYNKAVQRFLNHYYPSPQDTFKIIFQLSLFFKEYSQFENSKTPQFRHPPIRGQIEHFQEISIYEELVGMNMYQKCKLKNKQSLQQNMGKSNIKKTEESPVKNHSQSMKKIPQPNTIQVIQSNQGSKQVQKLNVRIKFHQQKFKTLYLQQMKSYVDQFYLLNTNGPNNMHVKLLDENDDDSQNEMDENKLDFDKIKKGLFLKRYSDYCEEEYHKSSSQKRSFYYYKQWIWMQFPWICQSLNNNYSELIQKCMKSPTEYMSIDLQAKFISEAIRISKIAKQSKNLLYNAKNQATMLGVSPRSSAPIVDSNIPPETHRSMPKHRTANAQSKQKFDVSKIDEELKKNPGLMNKRKVIRQQSSIFMTDITMSKSQIEGEKENVVAQTNRFPCINRCSSLANSKISKTGKIDITQTRDYGLLVAKYDEIKHQNEELIQRVQSIQQNRSTLKQNTKEFQNQLLKANIQALKQRKNEIAKKYKTQQALKSKLQMIIKLCDINKSHGSESADLNNFLSSLKNMFKIEEKNLDSILKQAKKMIEDNKTQYRKIKEQRQNILAKLKKQKNKLQKTVYPSPAVIESKEMKKEKNATKKYGKSLSNMVNKKQKLQKELEQLNGLLSSMNKQLGLMQGGREGNEYILGDFEEKVDKLNQIEWKLNELIDENNSKEQKIMELEQRININKGHRQHEKQVAQRGMKSFITQNLQATQQRMRCLQRCFALIEDKKTVAMVIHA